MSATSVRGGAIWWTLTKDRQAWCNFQVKLCDACLSSLRVSCLCLLDLSAAFDTIDHNILLARLSSWFGIQGSALDWFKSYLSSRSFRVKCNNNFSSCHSCICVVPQGSVLGPLLFILYTSPLSTLISSLSFNHHLYADDMQLFFSFYPSVLDSTITHLQHALQHISSWMTANLLTLLKQNFCSLDFHSNWPK